MFRLHDTPVRLCQGMTRREMLRAGGLGALGLGLDGLLRGRAASAAAEAAPSAGVLSKPRGGKAKSVIVLFFLGGPPQHETWDPKPEAPAEIRGDFKAIESAVPGIRVGELMPKTAKLMKHIAVLRGCYTGDNAHSTSGYAICTGTSHLPLGQEGAKPGAPNNFPNWGGVVRQIRKDAGGLPAAVTLPEIAANDGGKTWPGQDAGFLGRGADPWLLDCDPSKPDFTVPDLAPAPGVSAERHAGRLSLLKRVDRAVAAAERGGVVEQFDAWQHKAFDLVSSSKARSAFDLSHEPDELRDRYGRTRFGQSALLARRLVEAGVSLVQVNWTRLEKAPNNGHWDTHAKNSESLKNWLMPPMDQTYSTLLEDLASRGMLDETLVVWMGEFGRSPKVNAAGGRDHWGNVFSIALAGGGVKGGQVYGASDRHAAEPTAGRVGPADFTATLYHAMGIDPAAEVKDTSGRPLPVSRGTPVYAIF
ncbi:MAG TPA: DUF1501 domain-containing protein [Humisphaera sp.]